MADTLGLQIQSAREDNHPDADVLNYVLQSRPDLRESTQSAIADGYSASDVLTHLQERFSPQGADAAQRSAGLATRTMALPVAGAMLGAAMGAPFAGVGAAPGAAAGFTAASLAPMIADPLTALYNKLSGSNVQMPSEMLSDLMTKYGLPAPITRTERTASAVAQGVMAGGGGAVAARNLLPLTTSGTASRAILDGLSRAPVTQSLAGGTSTGAAQYVGEEGGSPMAQLGAGLAAGMVVPGGGITGAPQAAGRYARSVGGAVVSPFTQAGREAIVGGVLNKLSFDPAQARQAMQNYEPTVPGSRATTAGASRDPGLMAGENSVRGAFDTSGRFPDRIASNNQARIDSLDRIARDQSAVDWAKQKRADVTGPMREEAFSNALQVQNLQAPIIREIDQIMAGRKGASEPVQKGMAWLRGRLGEAGDDPGRLYEVRKDLANMISGKMEAEYPGVRAAGGQLRDVQRVIDSTIESVAPGYQNYMTQFAKSSRPIDMMELLQTLRSKSLASTKNPVTDADVLGAAPFTRTMRAMADDISDTLSTQQQKILRNISADIDAGVAPQNAGRVPGSDTIKNMTIANLTGRMLGEKFGNNATVANLGRPFAWLVKVPEERVQQLLMDAMLDPVLARDLMSKATTTTVGNFSARLQERAKTMGIAGAAGTGQAQARRDP
jgi:hypothetical protein